MVIFQDILTKRNCLIVCALTWLPNTIFLAIEVISYIMPAPTTLQVTFLQPCHSAEVTQRVCTAGVTAEITANITAEITAEITA